MFILIRVYEFQSKMLVFVNNLFVIGDPSLGISKNLGIAAKVLRRVLGQPLTTVDAIVRPHVHYMKV